MATNLVKCLAAEFSHLRPDLPQVLTNCCIRVLCGKAVLDCHRVAASCGFCHLQLTAGKWLHLALSRPGDIAPLPRCTYVSPGWDPAVSRSNHEITSNATHRLACCIISTGSPFCVACGDMMPLSTA
jgi:hypothetical protein